MVRRHYISAFRCLLLLLLLVLFRPAFAQENRENGDFKLAVGLYNDGMYDLAVEQLKSFVAAYPSTSQGIEARFYLGAAQMKLKRYEDARATFQNFALTYTDNVKAPEAWVYIGDAYAALNNNREAASSYERLKVFHPKSPLVPDALLKASGQYRIVGATDNAKRALRNIIQDYPSSSAVLPARLALAEIYAGEGNEELAEREANRVARSEAPPAVRAAALLIVGRLKAANCLFDEAADSYGSILKDFASTPSSPAASLGLGMLEAREGDVTSAVDHLKGVAENEHADDSLRAQALLSMGMMYEQARDFPNAQASYEKLISRFPRNAMADQASLSAGRSALRRRHFDEALAHAGRVIASPASSNRRQGLVLAAEAADGKKAYDEEAVYYIKFLTAFPNDPSEPEIMDRLGDCYREKLSEYRSAITVYDNLRQRYPRYGRIADVTFNIGLCQEGLNDYNGAITTCREIERRYPAFDNGGNLEQRIASLTAATAASRGESVNELASLLGELLSEGSKADIAFKLGNFYFHTLKDYRAAATYYGNSIDNGVSKEHFADAYYFRARAYDLLSEEDSIREKAKLYYTSYLKLYADSRWSGDAAYYNFLLTEGTPKRPPDAAAMKNFLAANPSSPHRDEIYAALGKAAFETKNYRGAIDYLSRATAASSPDAQKAATLEPGLLTSSYKMIGESYIALQKIDSAAINLRTMRRRAPADANVAEAESDIAGALVAMKSYDSAIVHLKSIAAEFYYTTYARSGEEELGQLYLSGGKYDDAAEYYSDLVDRTQASPFADTSGADAVYFLAVASARRGETGRAKSCYTAYLRDDANAPYAAQSYSALGVMARASGSTERASSYFRKAASEGGGDAAQSMLLADQLYETGQYEEAGKQYRELMKTAPDPGAKRTFVSGAILSSYRAGKLKDAEDLLKANKEMFDKETEAKAEFAYEKGNCYFRAKDYVNAKKAFDIVADDYETTRFGPWGHYYLGKILETSEKLKEAAKKYDEIIEKFPKSDVLPRVFLSLGNMHFNAERFEDAIRFFRRVVESVDSTNEVLPFALNNLIEAYESTKLYDAAIKTTRQYIELYPRDEHLTDKRIKLGALLTKAGYYDQAVENFQNILNDGESAIEAELRYNIGEAYYYKGDYQQAILEFLKVPYLVASKGKVDWVATSFYMAGQSYEKISKFEEAVNMYRQIIDRPGIDPTFKAGARKEIDRVKQLTKKG
jgi:TolA-binding protein